MNNLTEYYIAISKTFELSNGMIYGVGFIGLFDDLQKALDAANQELRKMNAPDYYYLMHGRESMIVTVNSDGQYIDEVDDGEGFGIEINVIRPKMNHVYSNEETLV